jgi:Protein of unknown function (DUF2905)
MLPDLCAVILTVSWRRKRREAGVLTELGKALLAIGLLLAVVGAVLLVAGRLGLPFGRLPVDFSYRGKDFSVFFPLGTSILISVLLSAIFYLVSRFRR